MRRLRRAGATLAGLVLVASLTGCASQTDRYCQELRSQKETLSNLAVQSDRPGKDVLHETLQVWKGLRDQAPADIEDEWTTLVFSLENLVDAFHKAGATPQDYDPSSPPRGVSKREAKDLQDAAAKLASQRVRAAAEAVEQQARDVCNVDLGLSS